MLQAEGRLTLTVDCESWIREAFSAPGIRLADLTPGVAIASTRLPGAFQGDPADRVLIATARESGAVLLTADRTILDYGQAGHIQVATA